MISVVECNSYFALSQMPDNAVDCIITDPPYDLDETTKMKFHEQMVRVTRGDVVVFSPIENEWRFPGLTDILYWVKPVSTKNFSKHYGRFVELIFVYRKDLSSWNTKLHWSNYTGVFHDQVTKISAHPFEKPLALIERLMLIHSKPGDTIVDPFCGSGTTLLTAERNGRDAIGYDLDTSRVVNQDWCVNVNDEN